jgi:hypothetical protein
MGSIQKEGLEGGKHVEDKNMMTWTGPQLCGKRDEKDRPGLDLE